MNEVITKPEKRSTRSTKLPGATQKPLEKRVGIAFQGGSFLAGAVHTGVMHALLAQQVFEKPIAGCRYQAHAFSGTSAGALVAAVCWCAAMKGDFGSLASDLKEQWLYNALSMIPCQEFGDFLKLVDANARLNPLYDYAAENYRIPWFRERFQEWARAFIHPREAVKALHGWDESSMGNHPHVAFGTADVLEGEIVTFTERDFLAEAKHVLKQQPEKLDVAWDAGSSFMLEAVMASGSLDEINGMTTIKTPLHKGTYLDGAWGENPPIDVMIDFGVDEIWIVEIFPKYRQRVPKTHAEREDRKEELWQNSLVEQQVYMIRKVNEWLAKGWLQPSDKSYRPIEVRRLPMTLDFTPGARLVNTPSFLQEMMDYGHENALRFVSRLEAAGALTPA